MKLRKIASLLIASLSVLSGCSNEDKKPLLAHADYVLYGEMDSNNLFFNPSLEVFDNLYNSNLNFIVMFSDEGCSACQEFKPIIEKYVKNTHQLVVEISGNDKYKINQKYKDKFFVDSQVRTPSVFVKENDDNIYRVDYSTYMKTYNVFKRHMESRYKTSKSAYLYSEIPGKTPIISKYSYVGFTANDTFKNMLSQKILNTKNDVIVSSNFDSNFISLFEKNSDGNFVASKTTQIDEQITDEIINQFL